jgi:RsiW-degrading membrane proteinase PrsW (M82 family)
MFWLFLLFLFGASYVYYRYVSIANKKIFFTSPFFLSIAGSLGILLSVIGIVNIANIKPVGVSENLVSDTLEVGRIDSSANNLLAGGSAFSYRVIKKLNHEYKHDYLTALRKTYAGFAKSADDNVSSLGNFGLGLIDLEYKKVELAHEHFGDVRNQSLPFFHFCKGELLTQENKKTDATREFEQELKIASGNRIPAYEMLVTLYGESQNYDGLHALLDSDLADDYFPERLARTISLRSRDFTNYALWTFKIFSHRTNAIGFIAAFLISAMWLVYLSYLDIFKPEKFVWLVVMFTAGMVFVPAVFLFGDTMEIITSWDLNSNFLNDFAYSIFMIGVPEEFAKILPLLIFTLFGKNLKEPVDYIIYGSASALGFAFLENLIYFAEIKNGIIHGRAYLAVIGHMTDTTIVAYAFVFSKYRLKNPKTLWYTLPTTFFTAAVVHGLYDVLLFHNLIFFFFIFFILIVQFWIIMINNAMNNSLQFNYRTAPRAEGSRLFITLALTTIFALEYLHAGLSSGVVAGNNELLYNAGFAGFFIIFFSSNLASFDLIKGYWRSVSIFSKEKRGYGNRGQISPLISWYFVNASRSHNYVGVVVKISNDAHNRILGEYLDGEYQGKIVGRIILYEGQSPDPHWFLIRMTQSLPLPYDRQDYILARLRYQEDSLLYEDYVEIFFKGVPDLRLLKNAKPQKSDFPFYGWANLARDENGAFMRVDSERLQKLA